MYILIQCYYTGEYQSSERVTFYLSQKGETTKHSNQMPLGEVENSKNINEDYEHNRLAISDRKLVL